MVKTNISSLGLYYNKYTDNITPLAHIDYRKQDNPYENVKNNNNIKYLKKNSPSYNTQITGSYLYNSVVSTDRNKYKNSWNVYIKPKPIINPLGLKLR